MPISFGSVPLQPPSQYGDGATTFWHPHRLDAWDFQGYLVPGVQHLPNTLWPPREPPRFGVLHWPVGADRWATLFLPVTAAQRTALQTLLGTAPTAQTLRLTDGAGGSVATAMYLIGFYPITPRGGTTADPGDYFCAVFVDERYFWWQAGAAAAPAAPSTWTGLLTSLFSSVGVTATTIAPVPAAYLTPNQSRWDVGVQPIPLLIEAAARTIGMRVVRALDGSVTVQSYAQAAAADDARWLALRAQCLAGGRLLGADVARGLPASCAVSFFDGSSDTGTLAALALAPAGGVAGVAGRSGLVVADPATPTSAQKTTYGAQARGDYYRWAFALTDASFRGFPAAVAPCGLDEAVEWVHADSRLISRVLRPQWADRNLYGAAGSEVSPTGGCSGTAWPALLKPSDCMTAAVVSTLPASVELSVTDCAECSDGASAEYTFTLSGGTGDFIAANGTWTVTRTTGCTWSATQGVWTITLNAAGLGDWTISGDGPGAVFFTLSALDILGCAGPISGWVLEEADGTGTVPTASAATAVPVPAPTPDPVSLTYDATREVWTGGPLEICGVEYILQFDPASNEAVLYGPAPEGGGVRSRYAGILDCGGCPTLNFVWPQAVLCPCAAPAAAFCDNLVTIQIGKVACGTVQVCAFDDLYLPQKLYVRFTGELEPLGVVVASYDGTVSPVWTATLAEGLIIGEPGDALFVSGISVTPVCDPTTGEFDGFIVGTGNPSTYGCYFGGIIGEGGTVVSEDPFEFYIAPGGSGSSGVTTACATIAVTITADDPLAVGYIAGYTRPGWYVTNTGVVYLDDESATQCPPTTEIICGPYDTEAEADAAALLPECSPDDDCIPIDGWGGAGWYCVETGGSGTGGLICEPVELLDADKCDTSIVICAGPYADEAAADAACGSPGPEFKPFACTPGGSCVWVDNGFGDFTSLAECQAACGGGACCAVGVTDPIAFSVSGPLGGSCSTTSATGTATGGPSSWVGTAGGATVQILCSGGVWSFRVIVDTAAGGAGGWATGGLADDGAGGLFGSAQVQLGPCVGQTVTVSCGHPCPS